MSLSDILGSIGGHEIFSCERKTGAGGENSSLGLVEPEPGLVRPKNLIDSFFSDEGAAKIASKVAEKLPPEICSCRCPFTWRDHFGGDHCAECEPPPIANAVADVYEWLLIDGEYQRSWREGRLNWN